MPAAILGPGCIAAIESGLGLTVTALADDRAGLALACLRAGLRRIAFEGPQAQKRRIDAMAARMAAVGCVTVSLRKSTVFMLVPESFSTSHGRVR